MSDAQARPTAAGVAPAPLKRVRSLIGLGVGGQIAYTLGQFAILLALAHLTSLREIGIYGLASAIAMPIFGIFSMGFLANQATDLETRHPYREFARLRWITAVIAFGLVGLVVLFLDDATAQWTVLAFAASRSVEARSVLVYGLLQKYDLMDRIALSLVLRGAGGAIGFAIALYLTLSVPIALLVLTAVWALVGELHDQPLARRIISGTADDAPVTKGGMVAILKSAWPSGVNSVLASGQTSVTRLIINATLGLEALGRFTLAYYVVQAANNFVIAVVQSLLSRLAHYRLTGQRKVFFRIIYALIAAALAASAVGVVGALALGDEAVLWIFGPEYGGFAVLLALCFATIGTLSTSLLLQGALTSARQFMATLQSRALALVFVIPASLVGLELAGLEGVVAAMALGFAFQSVLLGLRLWRDFPVSAGEPVTALETAP